MSSLLGKAFQGAAQVAMPWAMEEHRAKIQAQRDQVLQQYRTSERQADQQFQLQRDETGETNANARQQAGFDNAERVLEEERNWMKDGYTYEKVDGVTWETNVKTKKREMMHDENKGFGRGPGTQERLIGLYQEMGLSPEDAISMANQSKGESLTDFRAKMVEMLTSSGQYEAGTPEFDDMMDELVKARNGGAPVPTDGGGGGDKDKGDKDKGKGGNRPKNYAEAYKVMKAKNPNAEDAVINKAIKDKLGFEPPDNRNAGTRRKDTRDNAPAVEAFSDRFDEDFVASGSLPGEKRKSNRDRPDRQPGGGGSDLQPAGDETDLQPGGDGTDRMLVAALFGEDNENGDEGLETLIAGATGPGMVDKAMGQPGATEDPEAGPVDESEDITDPIVAYKTLSEVRSDEEMPVELLEAYMAAVEDPKEKARIQAVLQQINTSKYALAGS